MRQELLELARGLRRRVEQSHRSAWVCRAPAIRVVFASPGVPAGAPGELWDRILAAIGYARRDVHVLDIAPAAPASGASGWAAQIRGLAPEVIVTLGDEAARVLTGSGEPLSRLRGIWREYRDGDMVCRLLPTYHPADLLRDPALKRDVWQDMKALKSELER